MPGVVCDRTIMPRLAEVNRQATVYAAIRHEPTAAVPYCLRYDEAVDGHAAGRALDEYYGGRHWRDYLRNYLCLSAGAVDGKFGPAPGGFRQCVYGSTWQVDQKPVHLVAPALPQPTLRGFKFPAAERLFPGDWERAARARIAQSPDCFQVGAIGYGLWERAWALRGFSEALMDLAAEPEFFRDLLAALTEHQLELLDRVLALPIDGLMFSDDYGAQQGVLMGPDRWREFIKPPLARLYARVKAAGKVVIAHCCGSAYDLIPDLIEIGLDVLESVQPEARHMDPYRLKDEFGDRLTFWGGLGSQSLVPHGAPGEVRAEIGRLVPHMTRGGGYILATSKALQDDTPAANAAAIVEEFRRFGEPGAEPIPQRRG
jgi:uroporphyrinogen decarboxylase